jgi:tRNA(fMet)-specific endonuclease VapC
MTGATFRLLDTNTASFIIRGDPRLLRHLQSHPVASIGISAITEAELLYGLARKPGATTLAAAVTSFLKHVQVLSWDGAAAERYGTLRAGLEASGTPMGGMDTLIAAHALAIGATLVTNDQAFRRIDGLRVEDWTTAEA